MQADAVNSDAFPIGHYDLDDALIEATARDGKTRARVYVFPGVAVVLGRGSKPEVELDLDACRRDGVAMLRRRGGGCAVVLDPGNVIVSVALRAEGIGGNRAHFAKISAWLAAALERAGIPGVTHQGTSDLVLGDRKVGGACIWRAKGLLYYSTTLLVSPRVDLMERYLRHPPREPAYRRARAHAEFVGSLAEDGRGAVPRPGPRVSAETVASALRRILNVTAEGIVLPVDSPRRAPCPR